ncbi:MAG TPA: flagellar hook capping FlgD N-terminal domain-containing protein [Ignavibacteriaceae bacterium]|nr:flagellar hook capping FlgD N-terminal domain-containing protein [Ignavibacteriaceae bacterium]
MVNTVGSTTAASTTNTASATTQANDTLGKNDFMTLLIAQMKNQDPLNPMDGTQFASQLAQFSSLQELQNLNDSMTQSISANYSLAQSINNTMSATLIGKDVKVSGNDITYNGQNSIQLGYNLQSDASSASINIYDSNGTLIKTLDNLPTGSGDNTTAWDFTDNSGNKVPAGNYTFEVDAKTSTGADMAPDIFKYGTITGVEYTSSGTKLLVDNTEYNLSDISEIVNAPNQGGN